VSHERDEQQCVKDGWQIPIAGLRGGTKVDTADDADNHANDKEPVFFFEVQVKRTKHACIFFLKKYRDFFVIS